MNLILELAKTLANNKEMLITRLDIQYNEILQCFIGYCNLEDLEGTNVLMYSISEKGTIKILSK